MIVPRSISSPLFAYLTAGALLFGCAGKAPPPTTTQLAWEHSFEHAVQFHTVVDDDLLVVATERHLHGLDRSTGALRWRERNVNPLRQDVYGVAGAPYLLVTDSAGGRFDDADTHVLAVDKADGRLLWESPRLDGSAQQGVLQLDQRRLIVASVKQPHGDDSGLLSGALPGKGIGSGLSKEPVLVGVDLTSGKVLWRRPFGRAVRMRPVVEYIPDKEEARDVLRPFDLNGYHPPFLVGDLVCVTYRGVDCYHTATGELAWQRRFAVVEDDMALAYANPLVDRKQLFATGSNRVHAFDLETGNRLWRSSKSDYLPEIVADEAVVYAQLGGRFFDLDRERWVWRGEFGAMAIDRNTGKKRWRYDNADDSITNLLVLGDRVWLADEDRLISLSRSTGEVRLRERHGLKDSPAFAILNRSRQIVLVSQSTAAAFDTSSGEQLWQVRYPPPRPGIWRRLSAQLLQVSGTMLKLGSAAVSLSSGLVPSVPAIPVAGGLKLFSTSKLVSRTTGRVGSQLSDTAESLRQAAEFADVGEHHQYFLTEIKGHKGVAMATVDIDTGETVGLVTLPASTPDIVVDAPKNLIYQADGARLNAMPLRRTHPIR